MVICFSGEGNSRYVARQIAAATGDDTVMLEGAPIVSPESFEDSVAAGEPVVWVMPVYSWGVPPVVVRFIRRCRLSCDGSTVHHLVLTCGDDTGLAHRQWRRLMAMRGWRAVSASSVQMPNTYTLMKGFDVDTAEVERAKLAAAPARIAAIVETIKSGVVTDDVVRGSWAWIKSRVIYPYFVRRCMSPKPFHATDDCIACGKCAAQCPMDNIVMEDSRPAWGDRCALCLRCYHVCPRHAVAYGKATRGKGQYLMK